MERPYVEIAGGMIHVRWRDKCLSLHPAEAMTLLADEVTRSAIRGAVLMLRGETVPFKVVEPILASGLGG